MTDRHLILGTAGHIDHGKTALIRALTGVDTDRLAEEKKRGISIELGFASLDLGSHRLGVVDVPGHERFIRTMMAGASGIDLALLVIAADDGVMPQTREHLAILELLGLKHGVIALTKVDLVEPAWLELVEDDIRTFVQGTFLENAPLIRTSIVANSGFDELKTTLTTLSDLVEPPENNDCFRLAIDRSFTMHGIGSVITGTVWSGKATVGDELAWLPGDKSLRLRGIQHHGQSVETIHRGQRAALNVTGAHHSEIIRGHEIATPGFLKPSPRLTVHLRILPDCPWPLKHRARIRLHLGTNEVIATISLFKKTRLDPGEEGLAQLICAQPVVARNQQPLVIRSLSPLRTLGGGTVLQPLANPLSRREPGCFDRLTQLNNQNPLVRADAAAFFYGPKPWTTLDLCRDANLTPLAAQSQLDHLQSDGFLLTIAPDTRQSFSLHRDAQKLLQQAILVTALRLHDDRPLRTTIPRDQLHHRLARSQAIDPARLTLLINDMIARGLLTGDDQTIAHPDFKPRLSSADLRLCGGILREFLEAGCKPPPPPAVAKRIGVSEKRLRPLLELCVAQGELVPLQGDFFLHETREREARETIAPRLRTGPGLTVSEIKDALDTSRKYAVPICEYFDRIGFTRRKGDFRIPGPLLESIPVPHPSP